MFYKMSVNYIPAFILSGRYFCAIHTLFRPKSTNRQAKARGFGRDASYFLLFLLLAFIIHLSNPPKNHILIIIFVFCKPTFIPPKR